MMYFFILLFIAFVNAQYYYGQNTNIDYCLYQYKENCQNCPEFFVKEKNPSTNRDECRFVEHCIKFQKNLNIFIGDYLQYKGHLELSTGDSRFSTYPKTVSSEYKSSIVNACLQCERGYRINTKTFVCEPGVEYGYFSEYQKVKTYTLNETYNIVNEEVEYKDVDVIHSGTTFPLNSKSLNYRCVQGATMTPSGCRKCNNLEHCSISQQMCAECLVLDDGYATSNGTTRKTNKKVCEPNYNLNQNGECVLSVLEKCAIYDYVNSKNTDTDYESAKCIECRPEFILKNGECLERNSIKTANINNCIELNNDATKCEHCSPGYGLVGGKCEKCLAKNCDHCDGDRQKCTKCAINYNNVCGVDSYTTNSNGSQPKTVYQQKCAECLPDVKNCDSYEDQGSSNPFTTVDGKKVLKQHKCTECKKGYYLNKNQTKCEKCSYDGCILITHTKTSQDICSDYCYSQSYTDVSGTTMYKYNRRSSECKKDINENENTNINTQTQCSACNPNYYLTEFYTCAPCSSKCKNGCVRYSTYCINDDVVSSIDHCLVYSENQQTCLQCESDEYQLSADGTKCEDLMESDLIKCHDDYDYGSYCTLCYDQSKHEYFVPNDYMCTKGEKTMGTNGLMILLIALLVLLM